MMMHNLDLDDVLNVTNKKFLSSTLRLKADADPLVNAFSKITP